MPCTELKCKRVDAPHEHGQREARGLAAAIVPLCNHVPVWLRQDPRQSECLNLGGPLELHVEQQRVQNLW